MRVLPCSQGRARLADGWAALVSAVLAVQCPGCGLADVPLCAACRLVLAAPGGPVPAPPAAGCPPVAAVSRYAGPARAVLVAWKDHGRHDLAPVLAQALASAVTAAAAPAGRRLLLVPVPSAGRAVRRRGEDVVATLARRAAAVLRARGDDVGVAAVLRQSRRVRDQAALDAGARARNLAGALRVPWPDLVEGRSCVVVDDVVTTGATLAEAARALSVASATVLAGAAVAATARVHPSRSAGPLDVRAPGSSPGPEVV